MQDYLKESIFQKIEKEKIIPIPESFFVHKQRIIWLFIGALLFFSMIFTLFLFNDTSELFATRGYGGYENPIIIPPMIWIIIVIFLVFMSIKRLKDTSIGYRNSYFKDIVFGMVVIIIGGVLLRGTGIGPNIHAFVATHIPVISKILYNESSWNDPESGRIAGMIQKIGSETIQIQSIDGRIWDVSIKDSLLSPKVKPQIAEKIRILGKKTSSSSFEAIKIMPWFGRGMGSGKIFSSGKHTMAE